MWMIETFCIASVALLEFTIIIGYFIARHKAKAFSEANPIQYADATARQIPPPAPIVPLLEDLRGLGFNRIGELAITLPTGDEIVAWVSVDPAHHMSAELFADINPDKPPHGGFSTMFIDGCVQTTYRGPDALEARPMNDPDFVAQDVSTSLTDAHSAHRKTVERLMPALGEPLEYHTIADSIRHSKTYMERYFPRRATGKDNRILQVQHWLLIANFVISLAILTAAYFLPGGFFRLALTILPLILFALVVIIISQLVKGFLGKERFKQMSRL